ncbi:5'-deoxynucleotidase HDDC2 isoform X2 [Dromaius novaehollandiae]|uniref:5'-deoxynucleotidase HDDC2 isoform X2 n=1 Tax=Dromaius novaehollandiae TaxID=8790 RepID=UPI00311F7C72
MAAGGVAGLLQFLRLVGQLKRVPRTGWVYRNVEKPESVSDHMYRMAVMALMTKDKSLNKDRCIRLALVHDMAECIVGDIAPADNISKEEKHRREEAAVQQLTQLLSEDLRKEICELWEQSLQEVRHFFSSQEGPRTEGPANAILLHPRLPYAHSNKRLPLQALERRVT